MAPPMTPFDFSYPLEKLFEAQHGMAPPSRRLAIANGKDQVDRYSAFLSLLGPSDRACIVAVHQMREEAE